MAALNTEALKSRALSILKGFSPSQLVIIGLLSVLGLTGSVFFLTWVNTPTYGVLLAGLDAKDASSVTAKLSADGVPYKLANGGATVLVPQSALDKERLAVAAAGLPAGSTQDSWTAFDKQGLTSSSFQQQVAYQRALEATLASSLEQIEGVTSAQVHLALPEKRLFSDNQDPARASVLVQTSATLPDSTVDAMTHLVSSAVPALSPKDVSITDGSGSLLTGDGQSSGKADTARRTYEDALSAQVTSMFDTLLGPGHAVVRVNAVMDTSDKTIDTQVYDPKTTAVLNQTKSSETYAPGAAGTSTTGGAITSATPTGQTPGTTTGTETSGNGYEKNDSTTTNGVSVVNTHEVVAPGGVKRLTVAVAVDKDAKNAPSVADITSMVGGAVGLDSKRGDVLSVTTPAFLKAEAAKAPAAAKTSGPLEMVSAYGPKALGGLLMLLVGLGFLRALKRGTSTEIPVEQVTAAVEAGRRGVVGTRTTVAALPVGSVPAQRSSEELLGVLDDSPDEVAGMLRGWLANVGSGDR